MELNITYIVREIAPRDYSASCAELGDNAGAITFGNAREDALALFGDQFNREAFDAYFAGFGAWDDAELAAHSDAECAALMLQFIAGDMRECDMPSEPDADWWRGYEHDCRDGQFGGRIMRSINPGDVLYYIGE